MVRFTVFKVTYRSKVIINLPLGGKINRFPTATYRSVCAFLAGVFASPPVHVDMDTVYDVKKLLHLRNFLVVLVSVIAIGVRLC